MADEDESPETTEGVSLSREDLRGLRDRARAADEAEKKLAEMERKIAFSEAGLNLADRQTQYFVKGYEGELTAEAIRQEAEEIGLFRKEAARPAPVPQQELATHQQMTRATSGGGDPTTEDYGALIASAKNADEVLQIATRFGVPTAYNRSD